MRDEQGGHNEEAVVLLLPRAGVVRGQRLFITLLLLVYLLPAAAAACVNRPLRRTESFGTVIAGGAKGSSSRILSTSPSFAARHSSRPMSSLCCAGRRWVATVV